MRCTKEQCMALKKQPSCRGTNTRSLHTQVRAHTHTEREREMQGAGQQHLTKCRKPGTLLSLSREILKVTE